MFVRLFNKLKVKWKIESNWQIVLIILVFTLAGPTVVFIKGWYFHLLDFDENTPAITKTIAYLLFIFPAYQVLLLFYGLLLGQFHFFWEKEKALFRMIRGKQKNHK